MVIQSLHTCADGANHDFAAWRETSADELKARLDAGDGSRKITLAERRCNRCGGAETLYVIGGLYGEWQGPTQPASG